jgi:GNAT superfamily N-acetyltransferase
VESTSKALEAVDKGGEKVFDDIKAMFPKRGITGGVVITDSNGTELAEAEFTQRDANSIEVENIVSREAGKGMGYGTKALQIIKNIADARGVKVYLYPEPIKLLQLKGLTKDALVSFYEKNGFKYLRALGQSVYSPRPSQKLSEAYHKAKKDGSNPELVKAVEDLLVGEQQQEKAEKPIAESFANDLDAEYSKMKDSFFGGMEPNKNRLFFTDATNDFQYRGDSRADIVLMLDGANFWLTEGPDGYVTIEDFQVSEDKLGTGKGKFALSKLIEYADRNGITLIGEPLAQAERKMGRAQKGLSQKQLIEFYKKNGFEKISKDSLSKNKTAEANYLERKPKDSVEKTETEKPIAESRREFREKARKYFDGLKKLGFAFDAERNAKEDIAFLKALKGYIKLEIDNGMVTFKGFIEKTANLIEGFNEKDIASAAKKMWAEEIVKAYPKIYSKLQKAKKDLLDKEIQEARVTLQNSLKELLSDKKIFRKISSLTTERKLDKLSSDILIGMREEIEALGGLKKLSDEDLLFYNEMATQAYKEGQVIQGELINALKAKKEADKKNAKSAITNQDERSVVELKDANEARDFLSKNRGNNSNQVNINNGQIIVDSVEEFDILSSMFDKRTTFGGTTAAPNPNSVKRGKGSYYRTTVGGGLIYLLDKLKGKTPSQETINFFNDLIGQVKSGTFRKKRLNAELNNGRTSNISFLFKNRFAYTRRMLSTPRINGEKLVINDQNGSEIKNLSINHVLFFYQLMKDPHFLKGVKKEDGKIARKIGLEEQSMRNIIDFVNLEENDDLRELMSNDQVLIKRAAQNAANVMEANNISSELLNPRPLNLSAYENDKFIGEILNKIYNNSVPAEIEYFPSSVESDTNDQTPDVDALLGEDLGGKTVSAMSRFMIEREVGGTVKVKSYDAQLGEYFESMSNTAAKLPILKRFQAIFNKENTDLISSYYGKNTTNELKENIARYIVGRPQDAWLSKTISEGVLGKWLSLGLGIQMFLNLATALSQLSSSPGPILAYGVGNYLNGLSMLISGEADFKDSLLSLSSGKLFRERLGSRIDAAAIVKSIPSDERGYAAYFNEFNKKLISFGSAASSYFDAASILLSLPIYAREYSNARRTMTDQEAKDYAEEKIMDLAELFLQTRNEEMISSAESRYRTTLYSFATIVPQLHRQAIMAAKRIQRKEGDVKQNLNVLAWSAIGSSVAFRLLRPYFESIFEGDDEDEELKNLRSDKRTKRVALDLAVDATKSFGLYGAVSSAILKTGYQLVEAEEDASKVRMALDITPEIIESIPSVSIKLRNINDAIKSYYDDENLKGTTQGIQALTGLPIEKARMFAVQMSDGFLSDQFSMAEKVARISGFISENKAKEKLFQKAMSTDPLLREKLSPSEIQRFTTKQKNEYKSATSIIARQYSEATTESEREAAISRLISLQSGATKYDNAEELVNQIQDDFDKKVYENMLPKEFLEIKKMPSTKKVNFVANEFNATKNEQEAIDYLETLSAYGVISDNEKSEIVEILLKSDKRK